MHPSTLWLLASLAPATAGYVLPPRPTATTITTFSLSQASTSLTTLPSPTTTHGPSAAALHKRFNTICGFISGNPLLPATCAPGSHCAIDNALAAIGCCPDIGPCTTGIFTGCIDTNSAVPVSSDPFIFTCAAGSLCYRNNFQGGFSQFGCASATDVAASVMMSMTGVPALDIQPVAVAGLVAQAKATAEAISSGVTTDIAGAEAVASPVPVVVVSEAAPAAVVADTPPGAGASSFATSAAGDSAASPAATSGSSEAASTDLANAIATGSKTSGTLASPSQTLSSSSSASASGAPPSNKKDSPDMGAVIGGTMSGVAVFLILASVGFYYVRKKQKAHKEGIESRTGFEKNGPIKDAGKFVPLVSPPPTEYHRAQGSTSPDPVYFSQASPSIPSPTAVGAAITTDKPTQNTMSMASSTYSRYLQPGALPSPTSYDRDSSYSGVGTGTGAGGPQREAEDFRDSYIAALGDIREETESDHSRSSGARPQVPANSQRPGSNWL